MSTFAVESEAVSVPQRSRVAGAAGLLALAAVLAGVLNYAFSLVLSYELAPAGYVVFAGAQSLIVINGVVGSVGVPFVLAQEIRAADRDDDVERRRRAITFGFWTNLGLGIASGAVIGFLVARFATVTDATLIGVAIVALAIGSTGFGVLQGRQQTTRLAVITVLEVVVKFGLGVGLVALVDRRPVFALVGVMAGAMVLLLTLGSFVSEVRAPRGFGQYVGLLRSAVQVGSVQVAVGVLTALDVYVAASTHLHPESAANYQVAAALGKAAIFISSAVSLAVFPLLGDHDDEHHRQGAIRTYLIAGGFLWVALTTVPSALVEFVFSGQYDTISHWLPFTAALGFGLGLANIITSFVQSRHRPTDEPGWSRVVLASAVLLVAIAVMVSGAVWWGLTGLAITGVATAWMCVFVFSGLRRERQTWLIFARGLRRDVRTWAGAAVVVALLIALRFVGPVPWLCAAAVAGVVAVFAAFPEVRRRSAPTGPSAAGKHALVESTQRG